MKQMITIRSLNLSKKKGEFKNPVPDVSINANGIVGDAHAGLAGQTLIFVLPGSPRAVREYIEEIMKSLWHMLLMVNDIDSN